MSWLLCTIAKDPRCRRFPTGAEFEAGGEHQRHLDSRRRSMAVDAGGLNFGEWNLNLWFAARESNYLKSGHFQLYLEGNDPSGQRTRLLAAKAGNVAD